MSNTIPPAHPDKFVGAIVHPTLYLWDSWSYQEADETHLYCLAVSRTDDNGRPIDPARRNERPFHVRHFLSGDGGATWLDEGCFQRPRTAANKFDSKNIWSGSVTLLPDGRKLVAYTGLRHANAPLQFQQSIGLALTDDGYTISRFPAEPLSCPLRDWRQITDLGYYLADVEKLGHMDGEDGGPILAWRDPFAFVENDTIHLFWAAKVSSHQSALAQATLEETSAGFVISRLFEPITVPDGNGFTQLELPKILHDSLRGRYYLLIATCNRAYEGQSDAEVDKKTRIYSSSSLRGPWLPAGNDGSAFLPDDGHMFGLTVLNADFASRELHCIAPYTDAADDGKRLTLSRPFVLELDDKGIHMKKKDREVTMR